MALSSQGGLNFQRSRLQDSTESARNALTEFGSLAQRFQDNKLKAEALAEAKAQQAIENARADRAEAMQKEQFEMRKKEFDTMQNTLRATALGTTTFDKASLGQALLDKQAASIGGSDGNGNFNNKLLQESQALAAKYQPITNADGTSTAVEMNKADAARFKAIQDELGSQADKMIAANKGNMQVQKQLIGEVGNQYFKEGEDGPMLYDPTSLNKYKQDLLQGLDARIDREAARAQADAHFNASHKLALAKAARENAHMRKMEKAAEEEKNRAASVGKALFEANMPKLVKTPGKYIDDPKAQQKLVEYDKRTKSAYKEALEMFHKAYPDISISEKQIKDDKTGKVLSTQYVFSPIRQGIGSVLQTNPAAVRDQFERTVDSIRSFRADPNNKGKSFRTRLAHGPGATLVSNRQAVIDSIFKPSISDRDTILKEIEASKFGGSPKIFVPGGQSYSYPKDQAEVINRYGEAIQAKLAKGIPVSDAEYEAYVILKNKLNDFAQRQALYDQKTQDEIDQAEMKWKIAHPSEQ